MKIVWIAGLAVAATQAFAQTTIYKFVDEYGHVTYSNKPMKGAVVMDLEPLTLMPGSPVPKAAPAVERADALKADTPKGDAKPDVAKLDVVNAKPVMTATLAVEPQVQKKRENDRRRILEDELSHEEQSLSDVHDSITQEQGNPMLVAAVHAAQQAQDPTPTQMAEMRANIDKASGRIRGLQATAAEHEKNIEALKKELGALKP
ncbi:MAG TPA: DUF4124 domain-containing protein [Usitatibacter sp.]|nr:DUF4124 domain-containing protein [Usitatibacter sp.]